MTRLRALCDEHDVDLVFGMNDIFQVVEQQHQLLVLALATLVVRQVVEVEVGAVDVVRQVVEVVFMATLMPLQLLVVPPLFLLPVCDLSTSNISRW